MKKTNLLFAMIPLLGLGLLVACKKERLLTYDTSDNSIYYHYVGTTGVPLDTVAFTFAFSPVSVTDTIFMIPVWVTGVASKASRAYNVVVDTGTTAVAGKDYTLPATFVFAADSLRDSLSVHIIRTADMQTTPVFLRLKLLPSKDLNTDIKTVSDNFGDTIGVTSFKLNISDILVAGPYWTNVFSTYFGTFSVKKVQLINQVTGMPLNYITIVGLYDLNFSSRISYYAISMANYLAAQGAAGHPVYEADGVTVMTMGAAYQ